MRKTFLVLFLCLCFFGGQAQSPASLRQTLQFALTKNPYLRAERLNMPISQSEVLIAQTRPNPEFNAQLLQLMDSKYYPPNSVWAQVVNRQDWWQLTKRFVPPSQRRWKIDLAEKGVILAKNSYEEQERRVLFEVATKWLAVWESQKRFELIRNAKTLLDSLWEGQKNKPKAESDKLKIKLLVKKYAIKYQTVYRELRNRQAEMLLMVDSQDSLIETTDNDEEFALGEYLDSLLPEKTNRTDIELAQTALALAKANISYQKSLILPVPQLGLIFNPQNTIPYFGLFATISLPTFDRNQGGRQKAVLQKDQAEIDLQNTQKQAFMEIGTAWKTFRIHQKNRQLAQEILLENDKIFTNSQALFHKGEMDTTEFLEELHLWVGNHEDYHEVLANYRQSYLQVMYVTGQIRALAR